ncbi:MAG: SDR family oxidoreductase [Patescibacteria group bacterium]|jgi:dihydroflavonol-4-reductase
MIVVTGGTGHIGNVLVRELIKKGEKVRLLLLPGEKTESLEGLSFEKVEGDVQKIATLEKAFAGAKAVFHLAGIISISPGQKKLIYQVNVEGTKNVIKACLKTGVKRLVYTSSIHAFVEPPSDETINEDQLIIPEGVSGHYAKSKAMATLAVLKAVKEKKLNAVIVAPSGVIGPYDYKISELGHLIIDFAHKKLKAFINGAYDFVDVRDVVAGLIAAMEKGRKGEIYILSGEQIKIKEILKILTKVTGKKAPVYAMPAWLAIATAPFSILYYRILKAKPLFTAYSVRVLMSNSKTDHSKARQELGYNPRTVRESINDSYIWFKEHGYI